MVPQESSLPLSNANEPATRNVYADAVDRRQDLQDEDQVLGMEIHNFWRSF
jgi:hypothetical protein